MSLADAFEDDEIMDAMGCFEAAEYDELDRLAVEAYRTGDWSAYGARKSKLIEEVLAEIARAEKERSRADFGMWEHAA